MKRTAWLVVVALLLLTWFSRSGSVDAHAALLSSEPANNDLLQRPPDRIRLVFTEPLDTRASGIRLLDAAGRPVTIPAVQFVDDGYAMNVTLDRLDPGIYNVQWFNVSRIDGHSLLGSYPFTVLNPDGSAPDVINTVGNLGSDADPPPLADGVAVRLMAQLGMALSAGAALILLIWTSPSMNFRRGMGTIALAGSGLLFASALLHLEVLRNELQALSLNQVVFETRVGGYWLTRLGAALLISVMATLFFDAPRRGAAAVLVGVALSMWAFAATGHGAASASGSAWGTMFHLLHGLASLYWIGAVVAVAVLARMSLKDGSPKGLLPRFSLAASLLVFVAMMTGILSAFVELDSASRLFDTRYGWTLTAKILLLFPLLGVAAYNARRGKHLLDQAQPAARRRFLYAATVEGTLGIAVFVTAAMLTQTGVAKSVPKDREAAPFNQETVVEDMTVALAVDPNRTGLNSYFARLRNAEGQPIEADRVRLTFRYQEDTTIGAAVLTLSRTDAGVYGGQGPYLTLQGRWRIEVEVRRPDAADMKAFFDVRPAGPAVVVPRRGGSWDNPAPGLSWNEFGGIMLLMAGLGFALWRRPLGALARPAGYGATAMTALGFGAGVLLLFGVHRDVPPGGLRTNPIFPDANSIATGRTLYEQNCAVCHGLNGVPPAGLDLNPYPLDLTIHMPQHPADGEIFYFIANGLPGTSMRAWSQGEGSLEDEEIWHIVNYLRTS